MPHSAPDWIETAAHKILREQPMSVLDVGFGFGMAGMIAREYGDVWQLRIQPNEWAVRIDGIEIFAPYVMQHQKHIYNATFIGDALEILPKLGSYDLILCIDVLEHLAKLDGLRLLELIAEHGTHFLISTPSEFFPQTGFKGNEAERHLAYWTATELAAFGSVTQRGCLSLLER